jgi:eukaryotic-like serine/threonine-protein kinase
VQGLTGSRDMVRFEGFELDLRAGELRHLGGKTIRLAEQPLQILTMLLERPGEVVTREEVRMRLWADDTVVEFEHSISAAMNRLRLALGDSAEAPRYIETLARRGYRWRTPVQWVKSTPLNLPTLVPASAPTGTKLHVAEVDDPRGPATPVVTGPQASGVATRPAPAISTSATSEKVVHELAQGAMKRHWSSIVGGTVVFVVITVGTFFYFHRGPKLTEKDSILLADFTNLTGDPVFDGTLRQGLTVQLEQSPFLSLVSEQRIQQTLRLMGQPPDARLTPEIAQELCQRTGSAAVLYGSIATLGSQYVLGLKALNCRTGDALAEEQATTDRKERVLKALGDEASQVRRKLGESLRTVQKFDTPLGQATTPSLEALQAYSLGAETLGRKGDSAAAVPLLQRAIRLDPNFAMAYSVLGTSYANLGEDSLATENTKKAYELRGRASEPEKFYIESHYHNFVTGDQEKARKVDELWVQTYPRAAAPHTNLGAIYDQLGLHDKALEQYREDLGLVLSGNGYANLVSIYLNLNRLEEARATAKEAQAKNLDSPELHLSLYQLAFLQNDVAGMTQQVDWAAGNRETEGVLLATQAETAAYSGHLVKARAFSRLAVDSFNHAEERETAATYLGLAALREGLFGNSKEARKLAAVALGWSSGRDVAFIDALALAYAKEERRAQALMNDLNQRFPEDTKVQFNYLPTLRAKLLLGVGNPQQALDVLELSVPYELGQPAVKLQGAFALYPVFLRGETCLAAGRWIGAAVEFQKILDHRGVVLNEPIGALAHLGLARAYALQGYTAKARAAYQDFLTLWKDADHNIPVLQQAKAEYAKLQ